MSERLEGCGQAVVAKALDEQCCCKDRLGDRVGQEQKMAVQRFRLMVGLTEMPLMSRW